jgi:hypothetical protein
VIWNVLCPRCGATLDVTTDMLGGRVECGGCAQIFVTPKEALPAPDPRYDRRAREADDGYEADDPPDDSDDNGPGTKPGNGRAMTSMILGIIALTLGTGMLFMCCPMVQTMLGVLAILFGFFGLKTEGRKMAIAGLVMGALASIFSLIAGILIGSFFASMNNIKTPPPPTVKTVPYAQPTMKNFKR